MRQVKIILLSLAILSGIIILFAAAIPSTAKVSKAININASRTAIVHTLSNLHTWKYWYPYLTKTDSSTILINQTGKNLQLNNFYFKVTSATDSSVQFEASIDQKNAMESVVNVYTIGDSCIVNWYSTIHVQWYPWEKFRTLFFENIHGPSLDSNLVALKQYIEK